jgi:hypothetical protein
MRRAVAVVAVHGGALSNLVFADPGKLRFVLELLPALHPWMHYHHLCAALGVPYAALPIAGAHYDALLALPASELQDVDRFFARLWAERFY